MKAGLLDFYGNYADEEETADTIRDFYEEAGYVLDPHTAVAASVYQKYRKETKDETKTVIVSTASPYKFTRSVMDAIEPGHRELGDFELADALEALSGVKEPDAVSEIKEAPILHDRVCGKDEMKKVVLDILAID